MNRSKFINIANLNTAFTQPLLDWFDQFGRKNLPWQNPRTPYRVYVSEIMLQQTQVKTALPYFEKFISRFPTLEELAFATIDEVLAYWSGLGYYSRARNLHKTAQYLTHSCQGQFPTHPNLLVKLPGIGPSTAAAIASLAYDLPFPILDGNVKRVLARYFKIESALNNKKVERQFYTHAEACMSSTRCADYTQAIMDLGALCCKPKQPTCSVCPLQHTCMAYQEDCIENYPSPKPKKSLPKEAWQFLIFCCPMGKEKPAVYLEKRESTGIWGGLWSVPTRPYNPAMNEWLIQNFHLTPEAIQHLQPFKHTFTHFHLTIHGIVISIDTPPHTLNEMTWFHEEEMDSLGLPKPVKTLLNRFWSTCPHRVSTNN